jgi:hypothetical protein
MTQFANTTALATTSALYVRSSLGGDDWETPIKWFTIEFTGNHSSLELSSLTDWRLTRNGVDISAPAFQGTVFPSHPPGATVFFIDFVTPITVPGTYIMYFKHDGIERETLPGTVAAGSSGDGSRVEFTNFSYRLGEPGNWQGEWQSVSSWTEVEPNREYSTLFSMPPGTVFPQKVSIAYDAGGANAATLGGPLLPSRTQGDPLIIDLHNKDAHFFIALTEAGNTTGYYAYIDGFGDIPPTGVADVTGATVAMAMFLILSAGLWGYHRKIKQR